MRRIALLGLTLTLGGCGSSTWWNPPFTAGRDPNAPVADSDNIRRVMGYAPTTEPLTPETGDIWPGPLPPSRTLRELQQESNTFGEVPLGSTTPGAPNRRSRDDGTALAPPVPSPYPSSGSSVPGVQSQSGGSASRQLPNVSNAPSSVVSPPPGREPGGRVYQAPSGPVVTGSGTPNVQSGTTTGGGTAIVVPNGNGTSTIIHSDGRIETVPTPR